MRRRALLAGLVLLHSSEVAAAQLELIGGFEGNQARGFGFFTAQPAFGVAKRWAIVARATGSVAAWSFTDATGRVRALSPGGLLGAGVRYHSPKFVLTVAPAFELRWTRRRDVLGQSASVDPGGQLGIDAWAELAPKTSMIVIGSISPWTAWTLGRVVFRREVARLGKNDRAPWLLITADVTAQGNPDVQYVGGGLGLEVAWPVRAAVGVRAGLAAELSPAAPARPDATGAASYWQAFGDLDVTPNRAAAR